MKFSNNYEKAKFLISKKMEKLVRDLLLKMKM